MWSLGPKNLKTWVFKASGSYVSEYGIVWTLDSFFGFRVEGLAEENRSEKTPSLGSNHLNSQVAGNNRPLYPKVDHCSFKVAHNYEPPALQADNIEHGSL